MSNSPRLAQMPRNVALEGDDAAFVQTHLLDPHPKRDEKIGAGVAHFKIVTGLGGSTEVRLVRVDGSTVALPHNPSKKRTRTRESIVTEAMRFAIEPGRIAARNAALAQPNPRCAISGVPIDATTVEMDHCEPHTFARVRDLWMIFQTYDEIAVAKDAAASPPHYVMTDPEQLAKWVAFHDAYASYRPLHRDAHRIWSQQQQQQVAQAA